MSARLPLTFKFSTSCDSLSISVSSELSTLFTVTVTVDPLKFPAGFLRAVSWGPLLFLCYVNDMVASVDCKLLLYADDSALLVSDKNPQCVADKLSKELESCRQWLVDNKLSLHLGI